MTYHDFESVWYEFKKQNILRIPWPNSTKRNSRNFFYPLTRWDALRKSEEIPVRNILKKFLKKFQRKLLKKFLRKSSSGTRQCTRFADVANRCLLINWLSWPIATSILVTPNEKIIPSPSTTHECLCFSIFQYTFSIYSVLKFTENKDYSHWALKLYT